MTDRRTAEVWIYNGADLARLAELNKAVRAAEARALAASASARREGDEIPSSKAEEDAYDAFVAEAATRATLVVLRALGRKQWAALLNEHPPRMVERLIEDKRSEVIHDDDLPEEFGENLVVEGVNRATFPEALLTAAFPRVDGEMLTLEEPAFSTKAERLEWLDDLSGGDFDRLFLTAWFLNSDRGFIDPKATTFSAATQESTTTSPSRAG